MKGKVMADKLIIVESPSKANTIKNSWEAMLRL